ncbi:hypothetical protein REH65_31160 [Saccharopolyspora sp. ID03-671]|uniref:hypothetical protein n=1 Tax=Saccharopolyspora sp. ID03-671 TaxID=3073066 RepID=UPI003244BCB1
MAAALAGVLALVPPALADDDDDETEGPSTHSKVGSDACAGGDYCLYDRHDYNQSPYSPVRTPSRVMWANDREWENFNYYSGTFAAPGEAFGSNNPTNRVRSVVNNTDRTIYLLEWDLKNDPSTAATECRSVPPDSQVPNVGGQNSDEGYGAVGFSSHGNKCRPLRSIPYP